jgi:type VI secretion system protein ImpA
MALDIDGLVAPLSDEAPSGPDLSYEAERQQIELSFERNVSGDDGGGEEVDWRGTIRLIEAEAQKTRDIWLPVYLMRAAAQTGQFELVVDSAEYLARLMEERWEDVHPQLEELGFIGRKTPCESLTRLGDFLRPLGKVVLIEHPRLGRYGGDDFARFADQGSSAEGFGMFKALIEETDQDSLREIVARIDHLADCIRRVDTVLTDNADGDTGTNFQPTYEAIAAMRRGVMTQLPAEESAAGEGGDGWADSWSDSGGAAAQAGSQGGHGTSFSGGINSRDDVARALDAICAYYLRAEPNSPVPFALRRAREWISLDFMAVLEDIAPGGLDEAVKVLKGGRIKSLEASASAAFSPSTESGGWGSSPPSAESSDDSW